MAFDVQGGGTDLVFPHHEMSAAQAVALTGERPFARAYVHQAMVGLDGEKMSKSKGNLVLVSRLRADGVDPMAIRLALLAQHYRTDVGVDRRRARRRRAGAAGHLARGAVGQRRSDRRGRRSDGVRAALADDLDTPGALAAVDALGRAVPRRRRRRPGRARAGRPRACDALLGVRRLSAGSGV